MRPRIRPFTALFCAVILTAFFLVPYFIFYKSLTVELLPMIFASIMGLLFIAGIGAIIWLTLIVRIDVGRQKIQFTYPLRFKTYEYDFESIFGYRYKYLRAKIDYKAIQFRTKDGRKFTISDFETSNLRTIEPVCFEHLELREGKSFTQLNDQQKRRELINSKGFDVQQAKDIRLYLFLGLALSVFFIGMYLIKPTDLNHDQSFFMAFWTALTVWLVIKLRNVQRTIKNGAQNAP